MHRAALALAVAGLLAQQLGEHQVRGGAFGQAMSVAAVRAGDVVVCAKRLADADRDRFLADIQMRETRHQGACVEVVDPLLEQADGDHLAIHAHRRPGLDASRGGVSHSGHRR